MVLVGIDEKFGGNALHAGGIEGSHTLVVVDAVVHLAMDTEDRCVPFIHKAMGRLGVGLAGIGSLVFVPEGVVILPIAKPCLLGVGVHRLKVECTIVRDEALEALVVIAGKPIYAESSKAGAYGSHAVLIYIGQVMGSIVDSREIVAHALTSPIATYSLVPFMTESRQSAAVGGNDDISMCCHDLEIPTIAPELAYRTLRSAFAEEKGGILLVGIEVGGKDNPREHLLTVGGFHPSFLNLTK